MPVTLLFLRVVFGNRQSAQQLAFPDESWTDRNGAAFHLGFNDVHLRGVVRHVAVDQRRLAVGFLLLKFLFLLLFKGFNLLKQALLLFRFKHLFLDILGQVLGHLRLSIDQFLDLLLCFIVSDDLLG